MVRTCSRCGTANPDAARFCFSCGAAVAGPSSPRLERKFATALFADLVGSTSLADREDPEVVRTVVGRAFDRLAVEIERHGGLLEKFQGDAMLAVFGVPVAHEDDAERAVRAALEMQAVLAELNLGSAADGGPQLAMRMGIEAGETLVDLDRVAGSRDRMLTGSSMNTAARLQQAAEPGRIVVGPNVHAVTKQVIEYREMPALAVKGKTEPVAAWEVLRTRTGGRGERAPLGLEARLIGRDDELTLVRQAFRRVQQHGRPALVTILGVAGVGKSRLALELLRSAGDPSQRFTPRRGRCLAYANIPYSALAEAVKAQCGILEDDPPEAVAEKAARTVEGLFGDRELAPHIEVLVGSGQEHSFGRAALFDAWRRFLERIAADAPLVLVLEDIHWADDGLLDFVDHLVDWADGPIFVLTLARPELLEHRPGWGGGKRNYSAIYLDPLTPDETEVLVDDLLSLRLPDNLRRMVVDRSEGNPLFSEEIIRMFIDRGVIRAAGQTRWEVVGALGEMEVPRSIQALIAARVDSLPSEEKMILQDAAVIGRTFWLGAVMRLSDRGEREVLETLRRLRSKEIVAPREPPTFSGEREFAFHHALLRDVAYESLPKFERADKHVRLARWAEDQAGERREVIAELLATHYGAALRYLDQLGAADDRAADVARQAYRWARAAGDRAFRSWEQREAVRWFGTALELAVRIGIPKDEFARLWESAANAGEEAQPYAAVDAALERALALYDGLGMETDAGRVEARRAYMAFQSGRLDAVRPRAERALARLEPLGESRDLAIALQVLGWYEFRSARLGDAEPHLRQAMAIAERLGDRLTEGHAMVSLAFVFQQTGRGEESIALSERSLELARDAGDLSLLLRVHVHLCGALEEIRGEYRRAEAFAREGLKLARKAGNVANVAWMEQMLSDLLLDLGQLDDAEAAAARGLEASRTVGEALVIGYGLERVAYLHVARGRPDEAEQVMAEVRPILRANPEPWLRGWEPLIDGLIARSRGRHEDAAGILADGARRLGDTIRIWGGQNLLLECVRCLVRVGRASEALPFRDRLRALAASSVPANAFLAWAEGLLVSEPGLAATALVDAVARFERLERRVEVGRCLIDLAEAELRAGADPKRTRDRAREILGSCGAGLFLREVSGTVSAESA